jgi:hypothetical protein
MFTWLFGELVKERKVIKGAKMHFAVACLIAFILIGIFWYAAFSIALGVRRDTIQAYRERFGDLTSQSDKSPQIVKTFQVLIYTNDPTAERLVPQATNAAALAYKADGDGPLLLWDTKAQIWK